MIEPLPLRDFGLKNIPAVPLLLTFSEPLLTLFHLARRSLEVEPAKNSLSNTYTIGGQTASGCDFLFGRSSAEELARATRELERIVNMGPDGIRGAIFRGHAATPNGTTSGDTALTALSLDKPEDFSISWTNYENVYQDAQPVLGKFAATLTSLDAADAEFWPMIANCGTAYNLIILEAVTNSRRDSLRPIFGELWTEHQLDTVQSEGRLYVIDLSLFGYLQPQVVDGVERFTPATITLLEQDAATKQLKPIAVRVASGQQSQMYSRSRTPGAWLYALQAAKTSITVYGIWLGHVYHWHIVTAAMHMTMAHTLAAGRPGLVTGAMLKPGAVVVDVGINVVDGRIVGDVDFESASKVASAITPVPGGVGPVTNALLLTHLVRAAQDQAQAGGSRANGVLQPAGSRS